MRIWRALTVAWGVVSVAVAPSLSLYAESAPAMLPGSTANTDTKTATLRQLLQSLNQIPEDQLSDKAGQGLELMESVRKEDAPDYVTLKTLLGRADIRGPLNPGVKVILANLIAQRWDAFSLAGNLYLAGLKSSNPDLRARARERLVWFIQPAHVPVLIETLKTPGPNVLAFEVLQEVTGQTGDPTPKTWQTWWHQVGGKPDLVGHMLSTVQGKLSGVQVKPFAAENFWYLPDGIEKGDTPYVNRSASEQETITRWNESTNAEVKRYVDEWGAVKPYFEKIIHQPDSRVAHYLEGLVGDPGLGDYASIVLAWRGSTPSLKSVQTAYSQTPTVGRALSRGSFGDKAVLVDLMHMIEPHRAPLSYGIMDESMHNGAQTLHTVGILPAEEAFELLTHEHFGLTIAPTRKDKKKAYSAAIKWLNQNIDSLTFDRKHGYFSTPLLPK